MKDDYGYLDPSKAINFKEKFPNFDTSRYSLSRKESFIITLIVSIIVVACLVFSAIYLETSFWGGFQG